MRPVYVSLGWEDSSAGLGTGSLDYSVGKTLGSWASLQEKWDYWGMRRVERIAKDLDYRLSVIPHPLIPVPSPPHPLTPSYPFIPSPPHLLTPSSLVPSSGLARSSALQVPGGSFLYKAGKTQRMVLSCSPRTPTSRACGTPHHDDSVSPSEPTGSALSLAAVLPTGGRKVNRPGAEATNSTLDP